MNNIYFGTVDGKLVDNYDIAKAAMIAYGEELDPNDHAAIRLRSAGMTGIRKEIENPSVHYLIKRKCLYMAAKIYREKNPEVSMEDSRKIVAKMAAKYRDMEDEKK